MSAARPRVARPSRVRARPTSEHDGQVRRRECPVRHVIVAAIGPLHSASASKRLLRVARDVAGDEGAVWLVGNSAAILDAGRHGADRVGVIGQAEFPCFNLPETIHILADLDSSLSGAGWLFPDTVLGCEAASRLASLLRRPIARNVVRVQGSQFEIWSNNALFSADLKSIAIVDPQLIGMRSEIEPCEGRSIVLPRSRDTLVTLPKDTAIQKVEPGKTPLGEAPVVVGVGMGVSFIDRAKKFADLIGASFGATRPVCDANRVDRSRQIGASGKAISADVYLAFGISGAQQHLDGIREALEVVAVNTDEAAPIVSRARHSFKADADSVIECLLAKLEK